MSDRTTYYRSKSISLIPAESEAIALPGKIAQKKSVRASTIPNNESNHFRFLWFFLRDSLDIFFLDFALGSLLPGRKPFAS